MFLHSFYKAGIILIVAKWKWLSRKSLMNSDANFNKTLMYWFNTFLKYKSLSDGSLCRTPQALSEVCVRAGEMKSLVSCLLSVRSHWAERVCSQFFVTCPPLSSLTTWLLTFIKFFNRKYFSGLSTSFVLRTILLILYSWTAVDFYPCEVHLSTYLCLWILSAEHVYNCSVVLGPVFV